MRSICLLARFKAADNIDSQNSGSVRRLFIHPFMLRLSIGLALLGIATAALRMLSPPSYIWQTNTVHMLLEVCATLFAAGIIYCLWIEYCVAGERWILLSAVAISAYGVGGIIYALTSSANPATQTLGLHYYYASNAVSALLLTLGTCNTQIDSKQHRRAIGLRMLIGCLVFSFLLTATIFEFTRLWAVIDNIASNSMILYLRDAMLWVLSPPIAYIFCIILFAAALASIVNRHAREGDVLSSGIMKYLILMVLGYASVLVSKSHYDVAWWISHFLGISALLVLLVQLGSEFGSSYAAAHSRIEHLEAVHSITSKLFNTLDLNVVLLSLVSDTASMLSARFASIMLADDSGEHLATLASFGLPDSLIIDRYVALKEHIQHAQRDIMVKQRH